MHQTISTLLRRYEAGEVTRRDVISALAALVYSSSATSEAAGLAVTRIDHLSLQVSDLERSRDFYLGALGAKVSSNPRPANEIRLDLNATTAIVLQRAGTPGHVDHVGLRVESFERAQVTRQLRDAGVSAVDEPSAPGTPGYHIVDPDAFKVQLQ
jgi:catechol 2,3-dioxygenase-like lactoylglutathione lyase family enzyme